MSKHLHDVYSAGCPTCHVEPGGPCVNRSVVPGSPVPIETDLAQPHQSRLAVWEVRRVQTVLQHRLWGGMMGYFYPGESP